MDRRRFGKMLGSAGLVSILPGARADAGTEPAVRFSCMVWALEKQAPLDRCVEWVAAAGYQGVELVGEFHAWTPQETARFMAHLGELGLVVDAMSGVHAGFAVPDETETFQTQFVQHLQAAKTLACPKVILLSGRKVEGISPASQRQTAIRNLQWAADKATSARTEILIEPIDLIEDPTIYLASVTDGFDLVRAVERPNVKVLYDLYHEQRSFGDLIEKLENNIHLVGLVHVADVPGRHEPGTGEIRYEAIYRKLGALRYTQWIAMEYYPTGEPVASLRKARLEALRSLQDAP